MIRLEWSGHSAVYIDHKQLIDDAYNSNENNSCNYHLKEHLFDFKPRLRSTSSKARKRKSGCNKQPIEILDLRNTCDNLIAKLKQNKISFKIEDSERTIERIWEEPNVFPQLKGANSTNNYHNLILNKKEYIIPPRCTFFNHDLVQFEDISPCLDKYDFVVLDPPWKNKYIRRIKKAKQELGYKMMHEDVLSNIPLDKLIHSDSIVAVWCTNSAHHQRALLEEILPRWDLCLFHKIIWIKINTEGDLIGEINDDGQKQPYEVLFVAQHKDCRKDFSELKKLEFLLSVPSIIHSHKPPIWKLFQSYLPRNPKCLELFARYLQPDVTSIGLEVLKLMDLRLYTKIHQKKIGV